MDPKDNTEPNGAKDAQNNTPGVASTDATQPANMNSAPSLSPDESTNAPVIGGQDQGTGQSVEVDLSALSDAPTGGLNDTTTPASSDTTATQDTASAPIAFGDPAAPQPSSPDAPIMPPADSTATSNVVPPTVPDFGSTPGGATPDQQFGSAPTPSSGANAGMPGPTVSVPTPDQSAGSGVPPTTPVPVPHGDKKTIMVLGGVAVILIAAIVVLFLL